MNLLPTAILWKVVKGFLIGSQVDALKQGFHELIPSVRVQPFVKSKIYRVLTSKNISGSYSDILASRTGTALVRLTFN
jgi:hypothetical protein